jgi:hypothetical protein
VGTKRRTVSSRLMTFVGEEDEARHRFSRAVNDGARA